MRRSLPGSLFVLVAACATVGDDASRLVTIDHTVRVKSTAPAIAGQEARIYVREVVRADRAARGATSDGVVLFVHGAGTPAEVTFDPPYKDYSWMAYLARAGFDVYAMDMTGYGRSTRPAAMNDPCNFGKEQQAQFVGNALKASCTASYDRPITTMSSDWNDLGAVVDYMRAQRHAEKIALLGWSQGGPRAAGYTARNPDKVSRLAILAPAYNRDMPLDAP